MKRLSDFKGEDALDLWADLLDPLSNILSDQKVAAVVRSGRSKIDIAKTILQEHKKDAAEILQRIDDEPLNGFNIVTRLIAVLADIGENEDVKAFFGYAAQAQKESASSGSAMENTEAKEN